MITAIRKTASTVPWKTKQKSYEAKTKKSMALLINFCIFFLPCLLPMSMHKPLAKFFVLFP